MSKVNIIGARIGGLATELLLQKAGHTVEVYEKNSGPGGRAGLLEVDGFRFDTGPSWYLMPEVFERFFELLDTDINDILDIVRLDPSYKVFFERDEPLTIYGNLEKDAATFEAVESGAGAALTRYTTRSLDIYQMALKHFLYTNFRRPHELLHPDIVRRAGSLAYLASTSMHCYTSRFFTDQRLLQIVEYPMVFLGSSPFNVPAVYSLMGALDFSQGVHYPIGGTYRLVTAMEQQAQALGVTFYYDANVVQITTQKSTVTGIELADGTIHTADIVIANSDIHHTETTLLPPALQTYPEEYWAKREAGPSALMMYLGVRGTLDSLPHHSLFFVDSWQENFQHIYQEKTVPHPASIYMSRAGATDADVAPEGHEAIVILVPLPSGVTLDDTELEAHAEEYLKQLEHMSGIHDFRARIVSKTLYGPTQFGQQYNAWQYTALGPSHVLSQSALFRTGNISKKVRNLHYVGAFTQPGIGLPMCLISAEQTFKRIAGIKRGGPLDARDITGGT